MMHNVGASTQTHRTCRAQSLGITSSRGGVESRQCRARWHGWQHTSIMHGDSCRSIMRSMKALLLHTAPALFVNKLVKHPVWLLT